MKQSKRLLILTSLVALLPILAGLLLWDKLPDAIVTHWNFSGEPDGWMGKTGAVILLPLALLAIHWFVLFFTLWDPKNRNQSHKIIHIVFWSIPILSNLLCALVLGHALGLVYSIPRILALVLGLIFSVAGNYMPKCRRNSSIGIKTPWTFSSEANWSATHRFAGKLWFPGGILVLLGSLLPTGWCLGILFAALAVLTLVPTAYSYCFYRKEQEQGKV